MTEVMLRDPPPESAAVVNLWSGCFEPAIYPPLEKALPRNRMRRIASCREDVLKGRAPLRAEGIGLPIRSRTSLLHCRSTSRPVQAPFRRSPASYLLASTGFRRSVP